MNLHGINHEIDGFFLKLFLYETRVFCCRTEDEVVHCPTPYTFFVTAHSIFSNWSICSFDESFLSIIDSAHNQMAVASSNSHVT